MCGIAGVYSVRGLREAGPLYRMKERLSHRGPDDEGIDLLPEAGVGLVHTRLSVIDLSHAGHQPMWNNDRSVAIVFNGEIYNFGKLRSRLEARGAIFRSHTDTEVILRGYEAWGIDVVHELNGMFAFALWDNVQKVLWLARDRLGKKPLYYWHDATTGNLVFASEIKAILEWPTVRREVDPSALHCYLALGYVPAPLTMFTGIRKLPAGHWLRCTACRTETSRYWNLSAVGTWEGSSKEYAGAVRAAVEQAVERRLVSDVPVGAFFSGGVDSSIVVGLMNRLMKEPVRTFSAAFDVGVGSAKYNVDADTAETASRVFGTSHTRLTINMADGLMEDLKRVAWHMDEPHFNPTLVSTFRLARLVKDHGITVALSGDGSDEIFAGYSRYMADRYVTWMRRVPHTFRQALAGMARRTKKGEKLLRALGKAELHPMSPERYLTWWNIFDPKERANVVSPPAREHSDAPYECIASLVKDVPISDDQDFLCYLDLTMWIAEESNMRVDKMSMAHGLEVRAPFLDYTLVDRAMSIPFQGKVGWTSSKRLLKQTFSDLLPGIVMKRPKWGWISPVHYWLKGPLWREATSLIRSLPATGLFSPRVFELVDRPSMSSLGRYKIWTLMIFALWYQEYIGIDLVKKPMSATRTQALSSKIL